ncbi:tape measure protein [Pseudoalteromonas sp. Hal040]|uniref:tape measure protein n=1 Tax=unclassified Pseudoalteromonas TaxID=194690 RepID=UPI00301D092C
MANKTLELALRIVAEATGKQNIEQLVNELRDVEQSADAANPAAGKLADQLDGLSNQSDLIRAFEQSNQKLEQQEIATAAAAQALDKLQKEAQDTEKPFVQFARSIDAAEKDLEQMRAELTQQTTKHASLQTALKRSGVDSNNLRAAKRDLAAQYDKTGRSVDQLTADLKQGTAAQRAQAQSLDGVIAKVTGLAAAYVGLDRVAQAVKQVFETGDKFEKLGIQMQALMGGIAGGEQATAWVKEFTKNTPLQLGEVSQAFVKLKAFGLDPMDGTMQAITDQALKLGGGFQEVEGISLALGQAWAKQKLQGEEILQLVERGIPVWDLLEKVTGKNTVELQKLSSAGQLGRDVIKDLIDEMGRASAGSAAAQMALFSGQVSNAKDNLEQFYNLIAQSGAMDWLKSQITSLNTEFAAMAKDGRLKEWAQSISDTIVSTGTAIKNAATTLYEYRDEIATVAKVWLALKVGNYFSSVISGATTAIASMRAYTAAVGASTTAQNAATLAASKWNTALKAVGRAGLYTWLISELVEVGVLYKDLLAAEEQVRKSQQASAVQAKILADELQQLSNSTGLIITNMDELNALIDAGKLVWDEAQGRYVNLEYQQRKLAEATAAATEAERQRQALLSLTLPEALKTIESLEQQAQSLDGVKVGVDGFIQSIESARVAIQSAGEQYQGQLAILDALQVKFEEHGAMLERQKIFAGDVEKAYAELGITSVKTLDDTANKLRAAYELMRESEQPLAVQRQAYLKWAEAAIAAADATDETVPSSVQAAAAALGLTKELDKLIEKANALKPVTDTNSEAVQRFTRELDKTREAIKTNQQVLASSSATAEQKAQAQAALTIQQQRLTDQTNDLNRVQQIELASLGQLQREHSRLTSELEQLNSRYESGQLTAQEYNYEKERLTDVLSIVNNLLGDFKNAQDAATASTRAGTQATNEQARASDNAVSALGRQQAALDRVAASASKAASNVRQVSVSNGASVDTIAQYQLENGNSAYALDTPEIRAAKAAASKKDTQPYWLNKYQTQVDNAKTTAALNKIYKEINVRLSRLSNENKQTINDAIDAKRNELSNRSSTNTSTTPSYTAPTQTYKPTSESYASTSTSTANLNSLTAVVRELVTAIKTQQPLATSSTSTPSRTVRLELVLPNKQIIYAEFEERFLQTLEQLSNTQ